MVFLLAKHKGQCREIQNRIDLVTFTYALLAGSSANVGAITLDMKVPEFSLAHAAVTTAKTMPPIMGRRPCRLFQNTSLVPVGGIMKISNETAGGNQLVTCFSEVITEIHFQHW
jgi:hypothetical protein